MGNVTIQVSKRATYPAYKPSGMDWVGEVPEHWEVRRLKHIAFVQFSSVDKHTIEGEAPVHLCNYVDVYYNDFIRDGINFMAATATRSEIDRFQLRRGDVLITKDSEAWDDIAVPAYVAEGLDGVLCGYHLAHIRPDLRKMLGEYLFRAFRSQGVNDQFRVAANGITRFGLGKYWLDNGQFPIPPLDEQKAIAAFLDRETARIDALIEKKRRQIELLQEKRTALISHAVTKGLDPSAPMKDPGIEWLGQVPKHWTLLPLKRVARLQTGLTLGKKYGNAALIRRPYLRVANVQDGYLDLSAITEIELPEADASRYELKRGDVLMTEGGDFDKLGRGYVWDAQIPGCLHQNHVFSVRCDSNALRPLYLASLTVSSHGRAYFTSTAQQTTNLASTNSFKIKSFPVLLPPVEEQDGIIEYISQEASRLDALADKIEHSISMLREHRAALISAAVTGKIDVRGAGESARGEVT